MCWSSKVSRLCSSYRAGDLATNTPPARCFLSGPVSTFFPLSYERPARLLPALAVASIHRDAEKGCSRNMIATTPDDADVAATVDKKDNSIRQLLSRMFKSKQVKSYNDGTYFCITYL